MPESSWLIYLGAITGPLGAITGIIGAVVAIRAHRFTRQMKAQDRRLDFRKALVEYRLIVEALPPLIERAADSHRNAMGPLQSAGGNLQRWLEEETKDLAAARTWEMALPNPTATYYDLDPQALENKLVQLHAQRFKADQLTSKYEAELAADRRASEQTRATMEARANAMLSSGIR
jgi:hypothetical protein